MSSGQGKEESALFSLKKIGPIASFIYVILNIYKFLYAEWDRLSTALLVSAIILLWSFSAHIYLKQTTIGERFGTPSRVPAYPIWQRRVALACFVLMPAFFLAWSYYQSLPSEKIIVAVAEFQGPDPQSYRVTE